MLSKKINGVLMTRLITVLVLVSTLVLGITFPAKATLSDGSTFDAGNGKLDPTTAVHDWNTPLETITCPSTIPGSGTNCGLDLTKSGSDNAFGQGAKEDNPAPTVVGGSIPPNKSDLTRFYVNKEFIGGKFFIYLAWERSNVLGNANMDFEINQVATPGPNGVTPIRTPGDVLITFDFTQGGGNPVLGKLVWVTTANGTVADCFANNALPCWGKQENLSATGEAEGQVNSVTVHDNNPPPVGGADLPALTFGEAAVDLTDAGIFLPTVCAHFGSAFLKSRSSSSFTSEMKDFIAPVAINISNCGNIIIQKVTVPSGSPVSFPFTLSGAATPSLPKNFSLTDGTSNNTQVFAGSGYSASEATPAGWDLTSAVCDNGNPVNSITVAVDQTVTCTFTNTQRGALVVRKVTDPASDTTTSFSFTAGGGLSPTTFSLTGGGSTTYSSLLPGSGYSVSEGSTTGWDLVSSVCDNNSPVSNITVAAGQTVTCTFTNRARVSISIHKVDDVSPTANPLLGAGFTIYDSSNAVAGTCTTDASGNCTVGNLVPGTYLVRETTPVPGYDAAADQTVTLTAGQSITLTFVDPRLFQVIVLVCRLSDHSLYSSSVTFDGATKTSLGPNGGGAVSDATLCALGGASFGPKHIGSYAGGVVIP